MNLKKLTPRSTIIALIVFVLLIILGGLIFSSLQKKKIIPEIKKEITPPSKIVQDFYYWYMNYRGNLVEGGSYKTAEQISSEFISEVENRISRGILSYDPFSCGQDKPLGVAVIKEEINGQNANVVINTDFGKNIEVNLKLKLENDNWKIISIDCPQIEEQRVKDEEQAKQKVVIFLQNNQLAKNEEDVCSAVFPIERYVDDSTDQITVALKELFKGTTPENEEAGYSSSFSDKTTEMLESARFSEGKVYISLRNFEEFKSGKSECELKNLDAQIEKTIEFYKGDVEVVFE